MRQCSLPVLLAALAFLTGGLTRADDQDAQSILDKAIKALGGEEQLRKASAHSWKSKGKVNAGGDVREFSSHVTAKGLNQFRREFNFPQFSGVVVIDGEKGWRKGRQNLAELSGDALANEKRNAYLQIIPITLLPLKGKDYKCEAGGEENVGGKPAVVLKITAPDGKDFTLSFDKESGLPLKEVAKIIGTGGQEFLVETTFADYKDFGGVKKATKLEFKRDGEPTYEQEITDFKVLDNVDPDTFAQPK
jgi:hypothetical protein